MIFDYLYGQDKIKLSGAIRQNDCQLFITGKSNAIWKNYKI